MRTIIQILTFACFVGLAPIAATAQIPVPVPGAAPSPPPATLPTDPASGIDPSHPALTPSQLVGKSIHDLSKGNIGAAAKDDIKALRRGPLLIHGNYCGVGNRPGTPPIDALDAACTRHDACTDTGTLPSCTCDQRLRIEATAVAEDPSTPPELKITAAATAAAIAVLICEVPAPY